MWTVVDLLFVPLVTFLAGVAVGRRKIPAFMFKSRQCPFECNTGQCRTAFGSQGLHVICCERECGRVSPHLGYGERRAWKLEHVADHKRTAEMETRRADMGRDRQPLSRPRKSRDREETPRPHVVVNGKRAEMAVTFPCHDWTDVIHPGETAFCSCGAKFRHPASS